MSGVAGGERRNETCAIAVVINSRILPSDQKENDSHILKNNTRKYKVTRWLYRNKIQVLFFNTGNRNCRNQLFGIRILGMIDDIFGRPVFDDFAVVHHGHPVCYVADHA